MLPVSEQRSYLRTYVAAAIFELIAIAVTFRTLHDGYPAFLSWSVPLAAAVVLIIAAIYWELTIPIRLAIFSLALCMVDVSAPFAYRSGTFVGIVLAIVFSLLAAFTVDEATEEDEGDGVIPTYSHYLLRLAMMTPLIYAAYLHLRSDVLLIFIVGAIIVKLTALWLIQRSWSRAPVTAQAAQ